MKAKFVFSLAVLVLFPLTAIAQSIMYMDEAGNLHFVHSVTQVPEQYIEQVVHTEDTGPTTKKEYQKMLKEFKKKQAKKEKELKRKQKARLQKQKAQAKLRKKKQKKYLKVKKDKERELNNIKAEPKVIGKES